MPVGPVSWAPKTIDLSFLRGTSALMIRTACGVISGETRSKISSVASPPLPQSMPSLSSSDDFGLKCQPWQTVAARKRADREKALAPYPEWRLQRDVSPTLKDVSTIHIEELGDRELEIVRHDATSLVRLIARQHFSAVEVLRAFCHAATIAQDLTNCLTEIFYEEGLQRAAELDEYLAQTGKVVGPLHGLPVSIKDHILVTGKDTSTGYVAWAYKSVAKKDAVAVDILRKAGAVLYVKTNNPQTLLVSMLRSNEALRND